MQDTRIEHWLKSEGVAFTYEPVVSILDVDVEASKRNQARVNAPLIDDLVERYTLAIIDGAELPALIAYRPTVLAGLVLIDGNQRLAATIDAERSHVDMYIVRDCDEMKIFQLTLTANYLNGDPGSPLDHMLQAKLFHQRFPHIPRAEVARIFRLEHKKFERELRSDEVATRLHAFGLDPETLGSANRDRLHAYLDNDVAFREAAKFLQEANLRGAQATEFWQDIRRARSDADVQEVIKRWRERPDVQDAIRRKRFNRPHIPKSKVQQVLDRLNALIRYLERYPDATTLEVTDRRELADMVAGHKRLGSILAALVRDYDLTRTSTAA